MSNMLAAAVQRSELLIPRSDILALDLTFGAGVGYPMVNSQFALESGHRNSGFNMI